MPADFKSAAAALALPPSPSPQRTPSPAGATPPTITPPSTGDAPPWASPRTSTAARRLQQSRRPYALRSSAATLASTATSQSLYKQALATACAVLTRARKLFLDLSPLQRAGVVVALSILFILSILGLVFSHRIFAWLGPVAHTWRDLPFGWVLAFAMTCLPAFPPLIGYSTAVTLCGFIYGFPLGWPIAAAATVAGSTASFLTSRGVFSGYVQRLVGRDKRFVALGQVLRRDGLGVLTLVRVCPLPFSLSNGFLATVPNVRVWAFAAATALATPKLLVHVFIGSRLARLVEDGDRMTMTDRVVNYLSMAGGGLLGLVVGLVIYRRTMARAAELAREEAEERGVDPDALPEALLDDEDDAWDEEGAGESARLMNPDDAAAIMDDDDISLWEREGNGVEDAYRDSSETEREGDGKSKVANEHAVTNGNGNENGHANGNGKAAK